MQYQSLIESIVDQLLETKNPGKLHRKARLLIGQTLGKPEGKLGPTIFGDAGGDEMYLLFPNASKGQKEMFAPDNVDTKQGALKFVTYRKTQETPETVGPESTNVPVQLPGSDDYYTMHRHITTPSVKKAVKLAREAMSGTFNKQ